MLAGLPPADSLHTELPPAISSLVEWDAPMAHAMTPILAAYWDEAGKKVMNRIQVQVPDPSPATTWKVDNPHVAAAIKARSLKFCQGTNATTSKALNDALATLRDELHQGLVVRGDSIRELTKRVKGVFEQAETWRAKRIAVTESSGSVHAAQEMAAAQSEVVAGWEWLVSALSCPLCQMVASEAKLVPMGQAFAIVGHDPSYATIKHPPLHPSCRCTMVEVLKPEYGGPENPQWAETLIQPKPGQDYTPPEGKAVAQPDPAKLAPKPIPDVAHPEVPDRVPHVPTPVEPTSDYIPEPSPLAPPKPAEPKPKKPRAPRKPKPKPEEPTATPAGEFPADPATLVKVKDLGGSTGAILAKDPATGRLFVLKKGDSPDHLREEALADAAYRHLGLAVPESRIYETKAGPVKLSEFLDGAVPIGSLKGAALDAARKELSKGFAADALLGSWDVVGQSGDNVLVDKAGKVWRVDNGGSLRFRAQGSPKNSDQWDGYPTELWTLRDPKINPKTAAAFGHLTAGEIAEQIRQMEPRFAALGEGMPEEVASMLGKRTAQLSDVARVVTMLTSDSFKDGYADGFAKHLVGIRKAAISDRIPRELNGRNGSTTVTDEKGRKWDHLRGDDSLVQHLTYYMQKSGGRSSIVSNWMGEQASNSWSEAPQAMKAWLHDNRTLHESSTWWKNPLSECRKALAKKQAEAGGASVYHESFLAQHAFTYELLSRASFTNKDPGTNTVRLMRTETTEVMKINGIKKGDMGKQLIRGGAESTSIFKKVTVYGTELTMQNVPLHRIMGTYWQERYAGANGAAFLGDNENEFVAMLDGIKVEYKR